MKSKLLTASLLAAALFAGLGPAPVMAQNTNTPGIDRAHQEISARIQQGIGNGSITPPEAQALYQRGREIEMRENQFKANGNASPQERQILRADLDGLNADVERMMANRDVVRPANMPGNNNTPGIDRTRQTIAARIQQGISSGDLTPPEVQALNQRSREIEIRENQFKSNGDTSPQERQTLRTDLEALSADVERMMSNRDVVRPGNANTPGIDQAQDSIGDRIDEGVRAGRITEREARRLHRREREIARHEAAFKSDGVVTPQERRQLRNEVTALRDEVERMLRNDRRRG
jgi:ElaB/YqjD/DUF883 family membrane-anchored ribosome-binding protein